ncbi:MAG: DcrB-related protein [Salinicola sp.]|uniref:DcrB-related protein n=1 Tax=Salinicola sp. TaxID=1978524 RepID=UPI001D6B6BDA|nr:DcrB-related protein [Salinicola sp.]NRB57934.1 DcrB-related protein [Salinicola sp.]
MQDRSSIFDNLHKRKDLEREEEDRTVLEEEEIPDPGPPPRFHANELSFERPEGMQDGTWHVLSDNLNGPGFSIVIGRAQVPSDQTLESLAQQVLKQLTESADPTFTKPLYELDIASVPARRMQFSRRQQGTLVHQDQVLLLTEDERQTPLLVQFIATSANPTGLTSDEKQRFEDFLASIELRDGGEKSAEDIEGSEDEEAPS